MANCRGSSNADEIIAVIFNVLGIMFILTIGYISYHKIVAYVKDVMHLMLEILYFTAIITACIVLVGSIASVSTCKAVLIAFVHNGYIILCSTLLSTLILRFYITFQESRWSISKRELALSLMFVLFVDAFLLWTGAAWYLDWIQLKDLYLTQFVGMIMFILLSIWTVYNFLSNLLSLAKLAAVTKLGLQLQLKLNEKLNDRPQIMINISSKYVALFILASTTTIMTMFMAAVFQLEFMIHPGILYSIDCVVNILCLYLCHAIADHHYIRYCRGLDRCCRWKMIRKVESDYILRKQAISEAQKEMAIHKALSSASAISSPCHLSPSHIPPCHVSPSHVPSCQDTPSSSLDGFDFEEIEKYLKEEDDEKRSSEVSLECYNEYNPRFSESTAL